MTFLTGSRRAFFLVLAARIVPESASLDAEAGGRMLVLVEEALSTRPARTVRELALFLRVLRWLPALRYGRPLERLGPAAQDAALRWFQDSPVTLFRKGFWGVKTLVYLGYYGRPEAAPAIGYQPTTNGNRFLHAR